MAEAVIEDRAGQPPRFYCHVCKREFTNITTDFTCPVCSDGFIEELHDADSSASNNTDVDMLDLLNTGFREADPNSPGGSGLTPPFRLLRQPGPDSRGRRRHYHHRMGPPSHPVVGLPANPPGAEGNVGPAMINAYDQLIRDFFAYVGVPGGGAAGANGRRVIHATGAPGGRADQVTLTPMFFIGNPGDYVFGHDGLDSVITLMLNQLEPSGPPPMSAQKIDEIPKWEIGSEELEKKMQCSVCLEDFQLREQCRKLACAHIFHESCIVPWLELHGTCPICRDTFTEAQEENDSEDMETDAIPSPFGSLLSDIQRQPRVMDVLASNLPRTVSSADAASAGTAQSPNVSNNSNSNAPSSQSEVDSTSSNHANEPTRNNMSFHLDDGLD